MAWRAIVLVWLVGCVSLQSRAESAYQRGNYLGAVSTTGYLDTRVRDELRYARPLSAEAVLVRHAAVLAHGEFAVPRDRLRAAVTDAGRATCAQLAADPSDPHWSWLAGSLLRTLGRLAACSRCGSSIYPSRSRRPLAARRRRPASTTTSRSRRRASCRSARTSRRMRPTRCASTISCAPGSSTRSTSNTPSSSAPARSTRATRRPRARTAILPTPARATLRATFGGDEPLLAPLLRRAN